MSFLLSKKRSFFFRLSLFSCLFLGLSLLALAQIALKYRLLTGYALTADANPSKTKTSLHIFDEAESFNEFFERTASAGRPTGSPNFSRETAIGIILAPTSTPPKLSVSRVFVQDSTLTIRYIRMKDTSSTQPLQTARTQPMLLLTIPKQTVLKTRLIENGKLIQTLRSSDGK